MSSSSPMLAHTFDDNKYLVYPLYVQPKIDGIRCIVFFKNDNITMISRTGHVFASPYLSSIRKTLRLVFEKHPDIVLDGELYSYVVPFETLSGLCRLQNHDSEKIIDTDIFYYCFDVIDIEHNFEQRYDFISSFLKSFSDSFFRIVKTFIVKDYDEMMKTFDSFVNEEKYEGIMLRNRDGIYTPGCRSRDLQKLKKFIEKEFVIVGFYEAKGKDKGTIIWECETPEKHKFRVRPRGDYEYRKHLLENGQQYIGKQLTIVFQEYTHRGIPRFPVAKAVRHNY